MDRLILIVLSLVFLAATARTRRHYSSRDLDEIVSATRLQRYETRELLSAGYHFREDRVFANLSDIQKIVAEHNKYRRQEGASNMQEMVYSDYLASMASQWAELCDFNHGHPYRPSPPWDWIGQNLYAVSVPKVNFTRAVLSWYAEKSRYDYAAKSCMPGYVCGHYTAVVWWESNNVGCGYAICPVLTGTSATFTNAAFIVCNYGPGGNYVGEYPFLKGVPCSKCPFGYSCNLGLCKAP